MSLENSITGLVQALEQAHFKIISPESILHCVDLTLLDQQASVSSLQALALQAESQKMAALCVYPEHLSTLGPTKTAKATVVNFPSGQESLSVCLQTIEKAQRLGVQEIDYVADYQSYLRGDTQAAIQHCQAIAECCHTKQLTLKVILETGAFADIRLLYKFSSDIIALGCDFVKTSTGKIAEGASLSAAFILLAAIAAAQKPCGIKISGGVRTLEKAQQYASLAEIMQGKAIDSSWFRIGSSGLS